MGYSDQTRPGKSLTTGDQIASGAISLRHLSSELFAEFRQISLHIHSGVKTRKVKLQDLDGSFSSDGFIMRSPNGNKWRIQVNNSGDLTATAA